MLETGTFGSGVLCELDVMSDQIDRDEEKGRIVHLQKTCEFSVEVCLEDLGSLTTIAFDKTGTLTEGKPKLTNALPLNGFDKNVFLELVLDVESLSNHPLAKAISKDVKSQYNIEEKNQASNMNAIQGKGIRATYNGDSSYWQCKTYDG